MKKGFTLAETLITLGIIGVVAAITIPGLIAKYRANVLDAQFKEQYSRLSQALKSLADEEDISPVPNDLRGDFINYVKKHYRIAQDCGEINIGTTGCIRLNSEGAIDEYKTYTGNTIQFAFLDDGMLVLNDGTTLFFEQGEQSRSLGYYMIGIDINGYQTKPNRLGHDLFVFKIGENGELLYPESYLDLCNKKSTSKTNGYGCAKYAIQDKNYFKNLPK